VILAQCLEVQDVESVKRKMSFWIKRGLVMAQRSGLDVIYKLPKGRREEMEALGRFNQLVNMEDEDDENHAFERDLQQKHEDEGFENSVLGILSNQSADFAQIHNRLKIWQVNIELNEARLQKCLDKLLEEAKIEEMNGMFRRVQIKPKH